MIKVKKETRVKMGKRVYIRKVNEIIGVDNMMEKIGMVLAGNEMPYEIMRGESGRYEVVTFERA